MSHLTRIGVLRGGPSNEYEVSLQTGASVLQALRNHHDDKYHGKDVFIDKRGIWHLDGTVVTPTQAISKMDVAFVALHGNYGEDGKIQSILEAHAIPFTGSGALGSAVGMNKVLTKKILQHHDIRTPISKEFSSEEILIDIDSIREKLFRTFHLPAIVKPASSGSSVGITIIQNYNDLGEALKKAALHSDTVMVEEFINGIEATCGVVENFRDQDLYALPPIEIRSHNSFFDYEAKYAGKSNEIVPATFPAKIKHAIEELAKSVHIALGLRHYSRTDFMVHPKRGVYVLEVNTLPGLTKESLVPKSLRAVGSDMPEFVHHLINLALERK